MSTAAGPVPVREDNSNTSGGAKSGVKVTMLPGPAKGKTGQKSAGGLSGQFKSGRG